MRSAFARVLGLLLLATAWAGPAVVAQSNPTYVQFDPFTVKGVVYRPDDGHKADIGVLLIHRVNNYLGHIAGAELAKRGFVVLAMNSRFDNNDTSVIWEQLALDVKTGVDYLHKTLGVRKVILFGHSGGAATLTFYQAVAERGTGFCNAPSKIVVCGADYPVMPRADGVILADPSLGNSVGLLRGLNPAITDESDPRVTRADLDPFSPANGFNPAGPSTYTPEFRRAYFAGQAARMSRLLATANAKADLLGAGGRARFPDDDLVVIPGARGARLAELDPTLDTGTLAPQKLLTNSGRIVMSRVKTVRPFSPTTALLNRSFVGAGLFTLRLFLTTEAIRATDSGTGVDWCSTNDSTPCAIGAISVPLLVSGMQGGSPLADTEMVYTMAASKDKDFVIVEGATHNIDPCTACELRPGIYGNSVKNYFDYVRKWITTRF